MRSTAAIQVDLARAEGTLKGAIQARDDLRRELREAQLEEAKEKGHPWLGKKLTRTMPSGYARTMKTQKGTLTLYEPDAHRSLRGMGYNMNPGDLFVMSGSGKTGYRFYTPEQIAGSTWLSNEEKYPWELAE
jgi:hypothetical protein